MPYYIIHHTYTAGGGGGGQIRGGGHRSVWSALKVRGSIASAFTIWELQKWLNNISWLLNGDLSQTELLMLLSSSGASLKDATSPLEGLHLYLSNFLWLKYQLDLFLPHGALKQVICFTYTYKSKQISGLKVWEKTRFEEMFWTVWQNRLAYHPYLIYSHVALQTCQVKVWRHLNRGDIWHTLWQFCTGILAENTLKSEDECTGRRCKHLQRQKRWV